MILREESPADHAALRTLLEGAFGGTAEADLVEALREGQCLALSLVAEEDGQVVGHVALSPMRAPAGALALAPLAVAPGRQRRGIGAALVEEALARARSAGWAAVFVLGEPGYYGRFGFGAAAAAPFRSPWSGPFFQALELRPGGLPAAGGEARHAAAFDALA